jgi:DNA-directed RNA polymerase subunit RPC12/RpoP
METEQWNSINFLSGGRESVMEEFNQSILYACMKCHNEVLLHDSYILILKRKEEKWRSKYCHHWGNKKILWKIWWCRCGKNYAVHIVKLF